MLSWGRFIPVDVDHLREDVEELRKLFFQAKVPMQVRLLVVVQSPTVSHVADVHTQHVAVSKPLPMG